MPQTAQASGREAFGHRAGGGRVFPQHEFANAPVAKISVMDCLDEWSWYRFGGFGKPDQPVDRLREFRRSSRTVPQLALDEAGIGCSGPHDAADRLGERACP